jgi:hypothetical protein
MSDQEFTGSPSHGSWYSSCWLWIPNGFGNKVVKIGTMLWRLPEWPDLRCILFMEVLNSDLAGYSQKLLMTSYDHYLGRVLYFMSDQEFTGSPSHGSLFFSRRSWSPSGWFGNNNVQICTVLWHLTVWQKSLMTSYNHYLGRVPYYTKTVQAVLVREAYFLAMGQVSPMDDLATKLCE